MRFMSISGIRPIRRNEWLSDLGACRKTDVFNVGGALRAAIVHFRRSYEPVAPLPH
jgi:hypothetical protein